jgi:hypothetical protein
VEAANLPKISKMNAILSTINLSALTNDNVAKLWSNAQVPSPQQQIQKLVEKAENVSKQPFQSSRGRENFDKALKQLKNTETRGGNRNNGNGNVKGNGNRGAAVPAAASVAGAVVSGNTGNPAAAGAVEGNAASQAAVMETANALNQVNAANIQRLLQTNKSPEAILNMIKTSNSKLTKANWAAQTNSASKLKKLKEFAIFSNNLAKLASAEQPPSAADITASNNALRRANNANANALQKVGTTPELEASTAITNSLAQTNAVQAQLNAKQKPTMANQVAAENAKKAAAEAQKLANPVGAINQAPP